MRRSWVQLFLALGCAGSPARQGAPPPRKLTVVGINDTHGALLATPLDGLTMLTDAPRRSGGVSTRDQIVAYVKEHRPLTAELLGAASSGKEPRWTQIGSSRRKQAGE